MARWSTGWSTSPMNSIESKYEGIAADCARQVAPLGECAFQIARKRDSLGENDHEDFV